MKKVLLVLVTIFLSGCFGTGNGEKNSEKNIELGKITFKKNCAICHGKAAQGLVADWKTPINGKYPAPPLNGTAHGWHHSPKLLLSTINAGGVRFGGTMPGFQNQLSAAEKQAILDYLFSLWPAEIQQKYSSRFK
ncbi:MAG: cytochrome c [Candidatus Thioglobus sp.]|nr:cytochrome c [Candidatus Thioglobus sp.]